MQALYRAKKVRSLKENIMNILTNLVWIHVQVYKVQFVTNVFKSYELLKPMTFKFSFKRISMRSQNQNGAIYYSKMEILTARTFETIRIHLTFGSAWSKLQRGEAPPPRQLHGIRVTILYPRGNVTHNITLTVFLAGNSFCAVILRLSGFY